MKLSLFAEGMIFICKKLKNLHQNKKSTKKPVRINNKFRKVAGCKIKTKSVKFLYINNEQSGKEIK